MEACARLWVKDPAAQRGSWRERMPGARKLRLELGCGKGRFTAQTAAAHPEDLYVAVERVPDAMVIAMERCRALGLTNVFFIDGDAAELDRYFAPGEVDLIYINFCDPWPSVKHARRRLTAEPFLRAYRKVLRDGGEIHFKTDNHDLFEWSLFQFPKAGYELSQVTRDLHANGVQGIMTDYEEKFYNLGTPIHRCVGTKVALPDVPILEGLCRRLPEWEIRAVREDDLDAVLALLQTAPDYFALDGRQPDLTSLRRDLNALPPRCAPEQKHYVAFWREGKPEAVLDWVEGYPREQTLWVGLFLVDGTLQGKGLGRALMSALPGAAWDGGMDRLRLACLKHNEKGHRFWLSLGYRDLRDGVSTEGDAVWIMERLAQADEPSGGDDGKDMDVTSGHETMVRPMGDGDR